MSKKNKLKAAIVGCGGIACGYDRDTLESVALTHAKAYSLSPDVDLVAVCDLDLERANACSQRWGGAPFDNARDMLKHTSPDIVSICTPDSSHLEILEVCAEYPVKAIWCEKPICTVTQDSESVVAACTEKGIRIVVNYFRRWEAEHARIGRKIRSGEYGSITKVVAYYSKGLVHSGSHFLDLFIDWFGPVESSEVLNIVDDAEVDDPVLDVLIRFRNGVCAYLLGGREEFYGLDEVDVHAERGRMRISDYSRKIFLYSVEGEPLAGGRKLTATPDVRSTSFETVMRDILASIVTSLGKGEELPSTGETALTTLNVCRSILASYENLKTREGD